MKIVGNYPESGYALLKKLIEPPMAGNLLRTISKDLGRTAFPMTGKEAVPGVVKRPTFQIHGDRYAPLRFFLWGLTPLLSNVVGTELLPTFGMLRVYRRGDLCRVHSDKEACEHSLSITLAYSDDEPWPLQIGTLDLPGRVKRITESFEDEEFYSITMGAGDAVLYRGIHRRHGRMQPNPNRWSAHLFLFWVERGGPYESHGAMMDDQSPLSFG